MKKSKKSKKSSFWYVIDDFRKRWYGPYRHPQALRIRNRLKVVSDAELKGSLSGTNVTLLNKTTVQYRRLATVLLSILAILTGRRGMHV